MSKSPPNWLKLLKSAAYAAYSSNLIGGPPISHWRYEWFKSPKRGDLVMETSTVWMGERDPFRFGYLVSNDFEFSHTDDEWKDALARGDYNENDKRPTERIWRIKLLTDGSDYRWENADFIRVADDMREFADIGLAHNSTEK